MARNEYQHQLAGLREDVLEMSDIVCDRLQCAIEAYETKDEMVAEEVITGDHEINQLYLDLEQDCIGLLALQQPVAGDLRFIASSFKIITDLERIGDLAVNLGEYATQAERDRYPDVDIAHIGTETIAMVETAMRAYESDDAPATYDVAAMDDEIDARCEQTTRIVVRDLVETDDDDVDAVLEDVSRLLLTIRDLERVGDHAVNIAARTLYMVANDDELIY